MSQKNMVLPFVAKTATLEQTLTFPEELAVVVCLAESQRKKPGFLRDASERIASISKLHYPMWLLRVENSSMMLDGLSVFKASFSFNEPIKTELLIEELKRNSSSPEKSHDALKLQAAQTQGFRAQATASFSGLVSGRELLSFLTKYFESSVVTDNELRESILIPLELDARSAVRTRQDVIDCIRRLEADAKGLKYALSILKEVLQFQANAAVSEIERLEQKRDSETSVLKPLVDKAIKKLVQREDKVIISLQKAAEKKNGSLEKKRENLMRKLQIVEQRKDAVQKRIDASKKKKGSKSSSGSFALKKYGKNIDEIKKEIKTISDEIDKFRREAENSIKSKREEFQSAIVQEELQITQITNTFNEKTTKKQEQVKEMSIYAKAITASLENTIADLKRDCDSLRKQVELEWRLDVTDEPVLVRVPIYMIRYVKAKEERYSLFSPIALSEEISVLSGLRNMLALNPEPRIKALTHAANKKLQDTLNNNLLGKMQNDEEFKLKVKQLCQSSNLIDIDNFGQTLNEGLDEIEKKGWMRREESAAMCRHVIGDSS